jgi:hypothetical protein
MPGAAPAQTALDQRPGSQADDPARRVFSLGKTYRNARIRDVVGETVAIESRDGRATVAMGALPPAMRAEARDLAARKAARAVAEEERAAKKAYLANADDFAREIKSMWLRDMRKRAADLAGDETEAQHLLQHGSAATTMRHYRTKATKLKPTR